MQRVVTKKARHRAGLSVEVELVTSGSPGRAFVHLVGRHPVRPVAVARASGFGHPAVVHLDHLDSAGRLGFDCSFVKSSLFG